MKSQIEFPFEKKTTYVTALVALLTPVILGTLWIGAVSTRATQAQEDVVELKADLKNVPADVAVLKAQVAAMNAEQKVQYEALLAAIHERQLR